MNDFVRIWILPPLVGGIIGLFTNWLAIKMLFRPLKPIYIGRFKLPFTPGILPREREKLTESVGDLVSTQLLNTDVFKARMNEPALRQNIEEKVYSILDGFLSTSLAEMPKVLGSNGLTLGAIVTKEQVENFGLALSQLCGTEGAEKAVDAMVDYLTSGEKCKKGQKALLPSSATLPVLSALVTSAYDSAVPALVDWLNQDATVKQAEDLVLEFVRQAVAQLGALPRFLANSINYEKILKNAIPGITKGLRTQLEHALSSPSVREKVTASIVDYLRSPHQHQIQDTDKLKQALKGFLEALNADGVGFSKRLAERYETISDKPVGQLLPEVLSQQSLGHLFGLEESQKKALSRRIAQAAIDAISNNMESIVNELDVKGMVIEKIDAFDIKEAEELVLGVVNKELNWITALGGILGIVIGIVQSVIAVL